MGLEVQYVFKDSSLIWFEEWDESLYSIDFDSYTPVKFDITVQIEKGKGIMIIDLDSNHTEINIEELAGSFGLYPAQEFHIVNEKIVLDNSEQVCFED